MDQMHNDGLVNASVFGDGQHIPYDDNMFPTGDDHSHFNDASWGVNASTYQQPVSRAASAHAVPSWPQHASHVSASNTPTNFHGQSSVYARPPLHSPASFAQNHTYPGFGSANFNNFNQPHSYAQALPQENINQAFQQYNPQPTNSTSITPQPLVSAAQQVVDPADRSQSAFNYPILPQQQQQQPAQQPSQQPSQQPTQQQSQQPSQQPTQQALQQPSQQPSQQTPTGPVASITLAQPTTGHQTLARAIPASQQHGRFTIIDLPQLVRDTNSERFAAFATIGRRAQDFPVNRSTALPPYVKRNSRNELKRLARNDPKIMARLSAKNSLLGRSSAGSPRSTNAASPTLKNAQLGENIKYESESESEFESDNVSLYSDEEDDLAGAPLPAKKPEDAKGAVEYDTIKALWRNKRKTTDATSIRKGLGDFWEILKTIRDRWKTDIKAVEEAEEKKRVGDLALLKSRVKDQRDMLEVAFRAALKHGFRSIIELFSENAPFLYLCYQFLLDRFKAEDLNGQVSRMILEILSITTTITDEKLDRTFLGKVLPRYVKKGDGKTKFYARKILEGSASNSKGKQTKPDTESTAGVKRSSSTAGNATAPAPAKKPAVTASTSNGNGAASKTAATVKKPADATKPGTTAAPAATAKTKTVQAKPSNFFAGLQSVGKKPGTANGDKPAAKPATQRPSAAAPAKPAFNLAETLANLAKPKEEVKKPEPKPDTSKDNESPERKAKRVARLARGATGVRWKDAQDLVEIRFFSHDPAEELDHDASQMRDVKDVGGEGRMLKQHADMMDVDEDEDSAEDDNNSNFVTFTPPSEVDFSTVDQEDRDRQYAPYGGGKLQPDSPERKIREQYERDNLIVIYSDASEIPPNPREPADPYNGEEAGPCMEFGAPPDHYFRRANHRRPAKMPAPANAAPAPAPIAPIAGLDLGALFAAAQQAPQPAQPAQPAAPPLSYTDYLAQFHPEAAAAPPPQPQQHFSGFPQAPVLPQPQFQPQQQAAPARPNGEPDIAAILAALNAANMNNAAAPAQPAAPAPVPFAFQPGFANMFGNAGYQQQPQQQGNAGGDKPHPNYKTKVCKYWQEGKCKKGDECTYLHK